MYKYITKICSLSMAQSCNFTMFSLTHLFISAAINVKATPLLPRKKLFMISIRLKGNLAKEASVWIETEILMNIVET